MYSSQTLLWPHHQESHHLSPAPAAHLLTPSYLTLCMTVGMVMCFIIPCHHFSHMLLFPPYFSCITFFATKRLQPGSLPLWIMLRWTLCCLNALSAAHEVTCPFKLRLLIKALKVSIEVKSYTLNELRA